MERQGLAVSDFESFKKENLLMMKTSAGIFSTTARVPNIKKEAPGENFMAILNTTLRLSGETASRR
jgi:hypothetical protein